VRTLEERLLETKGQLAQAVSQNERLSATLREAREHIAALRRLKISLYEVSDVVPGESMLLRDLVRPAAPVRVLEQSATRSLRQ